MTSSLYHCIVYLIDGTSFKTEMADYHIKNMREVAAVKSVKKGKPVK